MKSPNSNQLNEMIELLKSGREELVAPVLNNDPSFMRGLFTYENDAELLTLFFEKQFTNWINQQIKLFDNSSSLKNSAWGQTQFKHMLERLSRTRIKALDDESGNALTLFCSNLLQEKIKLLEGLLYVGNENNQRYNQLLFQQEKDQVLFEREFKKLERSINGTT